MNNRINEIFDSWENGRNVLLYGPPATGKTRLISELFHALNEPADSSAGILLDPNEPATPFSRPTRELSIPQPVKVVWATFHQSFGYEDFILGLRPELSSKGTHLQPWAGVFLDAVLELTDDKSEFGSVVIFIDEINRGNAARIFGEFMTFLDFDYRQGGRVPLPLPLRQLRYKDGFSEIIPFPIICESLDLSGGALRRRINLGKQLSGKQTDNLFQLVKAWRILVSSFNNNTRLLGMWIKSEVPALDGATPQELLSSNYGRKTLIETIETMKFGDWA